MHIFCTAVHKKKLVFNGHPEAGQRAAILYSLIVSCQRHSKDPLAYLRDLFTRLLTMTSRDDLSPLLPRNWSPPIKLNVVASAPAQP